MRMFPARTALAGPLQLFALLAAVLALAGCDGTAPGGGWKSSRDGTKGSVATQASLPVETVRKAQYRLATLGYDPGPVDGVLGKKTEIAIKHFQVDEEVEVDGVLTEDLLARMDSAATHLKGHADPATGSAGTAPRVVSLAKSGPVYEVGDIYVYDDGEVETAARVGPEQVAWETAAGRVYTAHRNFILPPISWKDRASSGENRLQPPHGEKWPPSVGGRIAFSVGSRAAGISVDATADWSGKWRCSSGGAADVETTIGRFKAVAIQCDRARPVPGSWNRRTWYYVPAVGHFVRRVDVIYGSDRNVTVDLVAIRPGAKGWPTAAIGGLDWAVQSALDAGKRDKPVEWQSSAVGATFVIRVMGRQEKISPNGIICRHYVIERTSGDKERHFPAVACKRPGQDRWLIPGIDEGAPSPLALPRP